MLKERKAKEKGCVYGVSLPHWRGKPLTTYQVIINLITSTTTKAGLVVKARLDKKLYTKGKKVPEDEMKNLRIVKNKFHGEWNYTIKPRKS